MDKAIASKVILEDLCTFLNESGVKVELIRVCMSLPYIVCGDFIIFVNGHFLNGGRIGKDGKMIYKRVVLANPEYREEMLCCILSAIGADIQTAFIV